MKTSAIFDLANARRQAWKCLALAILAFQWGCALPISDGQVQLPKWQLPFVGEDKGKTPAEACMITGRTLARKGEYKKAIAKLEEARKLDPQAPVAHSLALLYNRQGDVERARQEFALALEASPKDAGLLADMGYFAFEHGNWSESESFLRKSLAIAPGNEQAWVVLGTALGRQKRFEESYDAFAKILSRDENKTVQEAVAAKGDSADHPTLKSEKAALANVARMQQEATRPKKVDDVAKEPDR